MIRYANTSEKLNDKIKGWDLFLVEGLQQYTETESRHGIQDVIVFHGSENGTTAREMRQEVAQNKAPDGTIFYVTDIYDYTKLFTHKKFYRFYVCKVNRRVLDRTIVGENCWDFRKDTKRFDPFINGEFDIIETSGSEERAGKLRLKYPLQ